MKWVYLVGLKIVAIGFIVIAGYMVAQVLVAEPEQRTRLHDSDGDGIADSVEGSYGTDPALYDTDGDGSSDGEEVDSGRNPLIAGDDVLRPLAGSQVKAGSSYTQQYLASLPEDTPQNEIINKEKLDAFVASSQELLVPVVTDEQVRVTEVTNTETVSQYFSTISSKKNADIIPVTAQDVEAAFRLDYVNQDPETMKQVIAGLERNIDIYQQAEVPRDIIELHRQLIALNMALLDNTKLLQGMKDDFVGGLIAARNLNTLGPYFKALSEDMERTQTLYGVVL